VFGKKKKAWSAKKKIALKNHGNEAQSFIFKTCFWQKAW
jgi:hypothetical protein